MNLQLGKVYRIDFDDPNYPCRCNCHNDLSVRHIVACCHDHSFHGEAILIGPTQDPEVFLFETLTGWRIMIHYKHVSEPKTECCHFDCACSG